MTQRRGGAHGSKKKRDKPHRPYQSRHGALGGGHVLEARQVQDRRAEAIMNQHYCEEQRSEIAQGYWMAFQQLKMGAATEQAWTTLAVTLNKAMILCENGFGEEHEPAMRDALEAMVRARERGDRSGAYRLDGEGLSAVSVAIQIHDEQMKLVVYRDIHRVELIMEARIANGNYYKFGPVEAR